MKDQIEKTEFGATVAFADESIPTMNFQFNTDNDDPDREPFWDYDGSRDTFQTLEEAIDDYVTYVTES